REKIRSPNDSSLASMYSSMASIYSSMNMKTNAVKFYEKSLAIQEASSSPNYSSLYVIHYNTARNYEDLGNYDAAIQHAERSLVHARSAFGSDDEKVQTVQNYVGMLRRKI
ncbi:unnamed protein product, partial [Rotaria sp. Silwood1]